MKLNIKLDGIEQEVELYNIVYYNQRLFCLGVGKDKDIIRRFITTKGFDKLLVQSRNGSQFNFKLSHFSPYLCSKEHKDIWRESDLLKKEGNSFKTTDIGPGNFSGNYIKCYDFEDYRDDIYFETLTYNLNKRFDIHRYQTDELYFTQHISKNKTHLPTIINQFNNDHMFNKLNIIHAVKDDGTEYFDTQSLFDICDADLGYTSKNSFYSIIRAVDNHAMLLSEKIGLSSFSKLNNILKHEKDCGHAYILHNITKKLTHKRYAFRYLYEYFRCLHEFVSERRKKSIPCQRGPKEFKKEDFIPVFFNDDMTYCKIVYFTDIYTIENRNDTSHLVSGFPIFNITGFYDYKKGLTIYDEFESRTDVFNFVNKELGVTTSLRLNQILATWFSPTFGYVPRVISLKMALKANCGPLTDHINLYSIPYIEEDGEVYSTSTFVNFYQLLATFGLKISRIANLLRMDAFSPQFYKDFNYQFPIYRICRDIRRPLIEWDEDIKLSDSMISIRSAIKIITLIKDANFKRNGYWYRNANKLTQSFPDTLEQGTFDSYQSIGIKGYVNNLKESKDG